jgi:hypothetical protein
MSDEAIQSDDQLAASYLQHLRALAGEISVAMEAITKNAVPSFRESVERQEMLCALLANLAAIYDGRPRALNDKSLAREIQATSAALQDLTLHYAALVKHSGRSIALLLSLCRSHTGQVQAVGEPRTKRQTWSCEM